MFCQKCGSEIDDYAINCPNCGEKVSYEDIIGEGYKVEGRRGIFVENAKPSKRPTNSSATEQSNANVNTSHNAQPGVSSVQQNVNNASVTDENGFNFRKPGTSNTNTNTNFVPPAINQPINRSAGMPVNSYGESEFDGTGLELWGYMLLTTLVSAITCGIAAPWMICKQYQWRISHTIINGKRLTFNGTGGSLFGHWILWEFLTIITCGIYGFFLHVALRQWELEHTHFEGEPVMASYFDGSSLGFLGNGLLSGLLLTITCGIAFPWVMCMLQKWDASHQVINGRRTEFTGSGMGFLGEYLIIALLTAITCGIYAPWGTVRMNKFIVRNTSFVN